MKLFAALSVIGFLLAVGLLPAVAQDAETLTVFAAASLTEAFEEIGSAFETANPGVTVQFNFGGSSALAAQLAEGAPADVFASANNSQMLVAQEAGRIGAQPSAFVKNRLILIVPADNPAGIQSLRDLAKPRVLLVVAAPGVPVRDYTDVMLERLAADPGYGPAYRDAMVANIVSEEDNVRQVAAKVALGEADAGIVYLSDVTPDIADDVRALPVPDALNTIATYPIAITDDTPNPELAQAFVDFVLSEPGQSTLVNWGFISARIPQLPSTITLARDGLLHVGGQVLNPLALSVEDLRTQFTPQTMDVTYLTGGETVTASFTGIPLWDILSAAQVNLNADVRNDQLSLYILASASNGYQSVVSWGELDPMYGGTPVLVAYEVSGAPLPEGEGPFRLVVPGDIGGGPYVFSLANLSVRDAPPVSAE